MSANKKISKQQLQAAYEKALQTYLHRPNITGIDIGYKYTDGKRTTTETIRFHVEEKLPLSQLETAELLPDEIDGVPTDVIQAVYAPQAELTVARERRERLDYIQPGISVGHPQITAGTLGAVVYDNKTGVPCLLSNWHVFVGSNSAQIGDSILQPGRADGGQQPQDSVATLKRSILNHNGDAAIAELNGSRCTLRLQYGTKVVVQSARNVSNGEILEKSGRSTGITRGRVDGTGRYKIRYSVGIKAIDGFKLVPTKANNPNNEEISAGGDSGSLWYDPESFEGVGLHFAGEVNRLPSEEHAIACHLPEVLSALDISLIPLSVTPQVAAKSTSSIQVTSSDVVRLPVTAEMGNLTNDNLSDLSTETAVTANWNPSPHYSSRLGYRPEAIVIHIAEGPFSAIGNWFRNPESKVSAHYGISKTGNIDQYVRESDAAWHAGNVFRPAWHLLKAGVNPNLYTIGIEHEGFANDVWTEAMYHTSADLVRQIAQRYGIPLDRDHVVGHREIYARKSCPGYQVDLDKLISLAQNGEPVTNGVYIVQRGDTLFRIASQFNTTVSTLQQLNLEITDINFIYVGQKIRVS